MKKILLTEYSKEELIEILTPMLTAILGNLLPPSPQTKSSNEKYATRKEVAERLRISLPTLHTLTKQGKLRAHRMNRRVLYCWDDVEAQLQAIETTKYKRKDLI